MLTAGSATTGVELSIAFSPFYIAAVTRTSHAFIMIFGPRYGREVLRSAFLYVCMYVVSVCSHVSSDAEEPARRAASRRIDRRAVMHTKNGTMKNDLTLTELQLPPTLCLKTTLMLHIITSMHIIRFW